MPDSSPSISIRKAVLTFTRDYPLSQRVHPSHRPGKLTRRSGSCSNSAGRLLKKESESGLSWSNARAPRMTAEHPGTLTRPTSLYAPGGSSIGGCSGATSTRSIGPLNNAVKA